jgi:hypothetical protein
MSVTYSAHLILLYLTTPTILGVTRVKINELHYATFPVALLTPVSYAQIMFLLHFRTRIIL